MKIYRMHFCPAFLLPAALVLSACTSSEPAKDDQTVDVPIAKGGMISAVVEGVPGGVFASTIEVNAKVTAIDKESREVTIKGADGETLTTVLGPEAVNFDRIEEGDLVKATVSEEIIIYLGDAESVASDGGATLLAGAPVGEKPGMIVADTEKTTATVTAIDQEHQQATLKFSDGTTETVPVRPDIDLSQYDVGEQVVFETTYLVIIEVLNP